jgi:hypothetical protein
MLVLTTDCLDRWAQSFDDFRLDFLHYCHPLTKAGGYSFTFNQSVMKAAHERWVEACSTWEKAFIMPNSQGLSHLKMMALLLHALSCEEWVRELCDFDSELERDGHVFTGDEDDLEEFRRDINAGRGTYLAFQFCTQVINWFENGRIDRKQPFEVRLTNDLEHDFMVYLLSERREPMAIFLILKALYVRDAKP